MKYLSNIEIEQNLIKTKLEKILEKSMVYECQIVATLWKEPDLYFEKYDLIKRIVKSKVWKFYLELGNKIVCNGAKVIDEITIYTYLQNRDEDKKIFESFGGYNEIEVVISSVQTENIEVFIDTLKKFSIAYDFISKLTITENRFDKLLSLNSAEDILSFFDIKLDEIRYVIDNENSDKNVGKINEGLEEMILQANEGNNIGLPINSPILNEEICGLRLGDIILVGGLSGTGKTSFTQEIYLSAIWKHQESVVMFLNEQDIVKWKQQFLTWIINNIILKNSNKKFKTKRWLQGKFTEEEFSWLNKATQLLNEKIDNNLIILEELNFYTAKEVRKSIKKYAKLGIKYFALDTFKVSADYDTSKGAFWFSMQEDLRHFYDLIKPSNLNVSLWITLQLEKGAINHRYMTGANIGMAKNIVDTASVVLLMRNMRNDEYSGKNNKIEVVKPITLDAYKSGESVILDDETKKHNIIFIEKNRNGRSQEFQIVARQNLGTLEYEEVGITSIPFGT